MINDKVAYVGDKVGSLTVACIEDKVVTLELEGVEVQLKMEE